MPATALLLLQSPLAGGLQGRPRFALRLRRHPFAVRSACPNLSSLFAAPVPLQPSSSLPATPLYFPLYFVSTMKGTHIVPGLRFWMAACSCCLSRVSCSPVPGNGGAFELGAGPWQHPTGCPGGGTLPKQHSSLLTAARRPLQSGNGNRRGGSCEIRLSAGATVSKIIATYVMYA